MKNRDLVEIPEKYFIFAVIVLGLYFLFRLLNQSQIITEFPIDDRANDYSSHIAKLYFLKEYGLHSHVPNWYNGNYQLLKYYSPGWYIFALPFIYLFNNSQIATYTSVILIYILLFLAVWFLGRLSGLSKVKIFALYLFTFANPVAIGYFLRLGKLPELFSWIWFLMLFSLLIYYKNKSLDKYFFLFFIPITIFLFYSHLLFFVISNIFILSLFLIKSNKERIMLILSMIIVLAFSLFFLVPFFNSIVGNSPIDINALERITYEERLTNRIGAFLTPLIFILVFVLFFWNADFKDRYIRKELLFYLPIVLVAILLFTKILVYVPYLNKPESKSYDLMFLFLSSFLLMKIKLNEKQRFLRNLFLVSLILIPIFSVFLSLMVTSLFLHHPENVENALDLLKSVDGNLALMGVPDDVHPGAVYSYGAVFYNITSISGWDISGISNEYIILLNQANTFLKTKSCNGLKISVSNLNIENIISSNDYCRFLESCNFNKIKQIENICLYSTK